MERPQMFWCGTGDSRGRCGVGDSREGSRYGVWDRTGHNRRDGAGSDVGLGTRHPRTEQVWSLGQRTLEESRGEIRDRGQDTVG